MNDDALWYYIDENEEQAGPVPEETILALVERGVLAPDAVIQSVDGGTLSSPEKLKSDTTAAAVGCVSMVVLLIVAFSVFCYFSHVGDRSPTVATSNPSPERTAEPVSTPQSVPDVTLAKVSQEPRLSEGEIAKQRRRQQELVEANFRPEKAEKIVSECEKLVLELRAFKDNPGFQTYGYSKDGPYRDWYVRLQEIRAGRPPMEEVGFQITSLPGLVMELSREYRASKGKETDFTRRFDEYYMKAAKESLEDPTKVIMTMGE